MTKPLPHRPGKGHGAHRKPSLNSYRIVDGIAYLDIGTKKYPGKEAVIDAADLPLALDGLGKWFARFANGTTFYATRCIARDGKKCAVQLHRHLLGLGGGHDLIPDHEDHDGLNNRRNNLRLTTHARNKSNGRSKKPYKGVFARKPRTPSGHVKYRSKIMIDGRRIDLGSYPDQLSAARAYDVAARELFGEFAFTNFKYPESENAVIEQTGLMVSKPPPLQSPDQG